jgi:hypothetical protein
VDPRFVCDTATTHATSHASTDGQSLVKYAPLCGIVAWPRYLVKIQQQTVEHFYTAADFGSSTNDVDLAAIVALKDHNAIGYGSSLSQRFQRRIRQGVGLIHHTTERTFMGKQSFRSHDLPSVLSHRR